MDKEPCKFAVNKRQNTNYLFLPVTSKVDCIRRRRGQIICLQRNNKSIVIFVLKRRKVVHKLFNVKYLPLFHHFKAIYQFQKNIIFLVKIEAKASLSNVVIDHKKLFKKIINSDGLQSSQ